jgi:uncharacterized protein (TIGR02186 family)
MSPAFHRPAAVGVALVLAAGPAGDGRAALVADLSNKEIAITTGFAGTELLLFGATDGAGDVVVVVRGPKRREIVRRKERIAGIWVNGESVTFDDVPAYYRVASTRPLGALAADRTLRERRIGIAALEFQAVAASPQVKIEEFREALVRNKRAERLYDDAPSVRFVGERLFRTGVFFPASVPTGVYSVDVHQFRGGQLVGTETSLLTVRKVGVGADIFEFAHDRAALYGLIAILAALLSGWLAGALFRRS